MPISPITPQNLEQLRDQVENIRQHYAGDILKILYNLGSDWVGDPAIFFRILLSNAVANNRDRLADVTERVRTELIDDLGLGESELTPYFNFRSKSEQAKLKDPRWA